MSTIDVKKVKLWNINPGVKLGVIGIGERMTLTYSIHESGSLIQKHKHIHEQLGYCLQGEAIYEIGDKKINLKKGYSFVIPPNTMHSAKVISNEELLLVETFSPPRPDLIKGEFAPDKYK
jgi:quercetin dioxygenase-like cupin family protein